LLYKLYNNDTLYVMYDVKLTLECNNGFSLKMIQYDRNKLDHVVKQNRELIDMYTITVNLFCFHNSERVVL